MGFFSRWFKSADDWSDSDLNSRLSAPDTEAVLDARTASSVLAELDINKAIAAHEHWKHRLQQVLDGSSGEHLDPAQVCQDDQCELGKWLHGPGRHRLGKYPAFTVLVARHKYFHAQAAAVLEQVQAGHHEQARHLMRTAYQHGSNQVLLLLKELKRGLGLR